MTYTMRETNERVGDDKPEFGTQFARRAQRRTRRLNSRRIFPSYRWEVAHKHDRWAVIAMQNVAVPQ